MLFTTSYASVCLCVSRQPHTCLSISDLFLCLSRRLPLWVLTRHPPWSVTDDDMRHRPSLVWPSYAMFRRASDKDVIAKSTD